MPYTGNPATVPTDAVRFWCQDTSATPLLSDTEVEYILGLQTPLNGGDPILTAAYCAEAIAARYATEVSISADGVTYSGQQLQDKYSALAKSLRADYAELAAMQAFPYAGGVQVGDYPAPGTRPLNFVLGQFDNPRAGQQTGSENQGGYTSWADEEDGVLWG